VVFDSSMRSTHSWAPRMSAWTDLVMMCLTFIFTVAWSVEVGIIVSVTASLLIIVRRSSMTHIKILVRSPPLFGASMIDMKPMPCGCCIGSSTRN
jgi:MFS superfamily sulfate permease-like transporter